MLWMPPFIGKAIQQTPRFVTNSNSKSYPKSSAQNSKSENRHGRARGCADYSGIRHGHARGCAETS